MIPCVGNFLAGAFFVGRTEDVMDTLADLTDRVGGLLPPRSPGDISIPIGLGPSGYPITWGSHENPLPFVIVPVGLI